MHRLLGFTPFGYDGVNRYPIEHPELKAKKSDGTPVDVSKRVPWSRQLDKVKDAKLIADYSRPEFVLAGWKPVLELR